jgi:ABC-type sugar transport system ATPase subunit
MRGTGVEVTGLEKSFGHKKVLGGLDLEIERGSVFCLLGPNGAGKTTTVHILSTLRGADRGTAHICGYDVRHEPEKVRESIGVTGQFSAVDGLLTGNENLVHPIDDRTSTVQVDAHVLLSHRGLPSCGTAVKSPVSISRVELSRGAEAPLLHAIT